MAPGFSSMPRNRGTSRRTRLRPCGEERHKSVREGNWIACRTLILCYIAAALQLWWVVEQPVNSFMEELPAWKFFVKQVKTYRYSLNMEDYGGPTKKPTWLYSGLSDMFPLSNFHFGRPKKPTPQVHVFSLKTQWLKENTSFWWLRGVHFFSLGKSNQSRKL